VGATNSADSAIRAGNAAMPLCEIDRKAMRDGRGIGLLQFASHAHQLRAVAAEQQVVGMCRKDCGQRIPALDQFQTAKLSPRTDAFERVEVGSEA
jgi:hypothetical protein